MLHATSDTEKLSTELLPVQVSQVTFVAGIGDVTAAAYTAQLLDMNSTMFLNVVHRSGDLQVEG